MKEKMYYTISVHNRFSGKAIATETFPSDMTLKDLFKHMESTKCELRILTNEELSAF